MSQPLSSYEKLRLENLRQNQKILAELGLRPVGDASLDADNRSDKENGAKQWDSATGYAARKSIHNASTALLKKRRRTTTAANVAAGVAPPSVDIELRRSVRLVGKTAKYSYEDLVDVDEVLGLRRRNGRPRSGDNQVSGVSSSHVRLDESTYTYRKSDKPLEKKYGVIDNVPVGTLFQSRMECCYAGIHGPTVAGIHPGAEGAYSVCLSGGYEDDVDFGTMFTYTGEGGRDLKGTKTTPKNLRTAPQSRDQTLSRGNAALVKSIETKNPVRVVRGYKLNNKYAPEAGYRYDGLYTVEKSWQANGLSGFRVFRFAFKRVDGQAALPQI